MAAHFPAVSTRRGAPVLAALLVCGFFLAACATLSPKPQPLEVRLEALRLTRFEPFDTRVVITLVVHNPNAFAVAVSDLEAALAVPDQRLLSGRLTSPQSLAAQADTRVEIEVQTDFVAMATALQRVTHEQSFRYEVSGNATAGGVPIAISRKGELPASEFLAPPKQ